MNWEPIENLERYCVDYIYNLPNIVFQDYSGRYTVLGDGVSGRYNSYGCLGCRTPWTSEEITRYGFKRFLVLDNKLWKT